MAWYAPANPNPNATRDQIVGLFRDLRNLERESIDRSNDILNRIDGLDVHATAYLIELEGHRRTLMRSIYNTRTKWSDITRQTSFVEERGPSGGVPGYVGILIPIETYNKYEQYMHRLAYLFRGVADKMETEIDWLRTVGIDPGESPLGGEGRGMPHHMQRGEMWQAGVNRRR